MPKEISKNFGIYPHLGICYIASYLQKHGIEAEIIDTNVECESTEELLNAVAKSSPDVVGLSCMTFTFLHCLEIARSIKNRLRVPVIFGGPHASIYPEEILTHTEVDFCVVGEGEKTSKELIELLGKKHHKAIYKEEIKKIDGLAYKIDSRIIRNKPRKLQSDIDSFPPPAIDLLNKKDRYYGCNLPIPYITMMTSRGCPYRCYFCSKQPWGSSYRFHSAERVVWEIEHLVSELGVKSIDFFDDTFVLNKKRFGGIAAKLAEKNIKIQFGITTRVNNIDKETVRMLKHMGCRTIAYGIESGNQKILDNLNKKTTLAQIKKAFFYAHIEKVNSVGFFLVGNPGEGKKEVRDTVKLIKEVSPDYFIANILIPYPGSGLYSNLIKNGVLSEDCWREVTLQGRPLPTPVANTTIPLKTLIKMRNKINRMPYLRLKSNMLKYRKLKTFHDVKRVLSTIKTSVLNKKL